MLIILSGFPVFAKDLELTKSEREWLESNPVIRLGVGTNYPPIQYVTEKKGKYDFLGIASDYVDILTEILGVEFEVEWGITFTEAIEKGRNKEIDMFPCIAYTEERDEFLNFTDGYLENPIVIFANTDAPFIGSIQDLSGLRVADVEALYIYNQLKADVPGIRFVLASNAEACLENLAFGRADANVAGLISGSYLIRKNNWMNIKVAAPSSYPNTVFRMAVREDWPEFVTILDKALESIDLDSRNEINQKWISVRYEFGIDRREVAKNIMIVVAISVLIVFLILLWVRRLLREISQRNEIEKSLTKQEAELRKMVEEREILIREVYHRVKNNLSLVASLVSLQSAELSNIEDVEKMDMVSQRIHSIILLHEQLSISSDLNKIDVSKYIDDLILGLSKTSSENSTPVVEICCNVVSVFLDSKKIIFIGLIVTELVTNAIKYGFPDKKTGLIEIDLAKSSEDRYLLRVKNNGVPIPEYIDLENPKTLGLKLVKSLIIQLQGEIKLIRSPSPEFIIYFT